MLKKQQKTSAKARKNYTFLIALSLLSIIGGLLASTKNKTLTHLTPSLTTSEAGFNDIVIQARGTNNKEKIALYINNTPVTFWNLSNNFKDYTYTPNGEITVSELSIHFLNDTWEPENNINYDVQIPYITVNGTTYNSEHSSTVSTGSWDQDNWCAPGNKQTQWLNCNGSFTYNIPVGTVVGLPTTNPICGNNKVEEGETCDDGNIQGGDGCSNTCSVEAPNEPILTSPVPNSTLISDTYQFMWSSFNHSSRVYDLHIGSTLGGSDYFDSANLGTSSIVSVTGLPTNGSQIYIRIYYWSDSTYSDANHIDFVVTAQTIVSSPVFIEPLGDVDSTYIVTWIDDNPPVTRRYDLWVDGVDQGNSVDSTENSWNLSNLSPGTRTIELRWWDGNNFNDYKSVSMDVMITNTSINTSNDYEAIKAAADTALADQENWYTYNTATIDSEQGYHSADAMRGLAQMYRVTNDPKYIDAAVLQGNKWIDSGRRIDDDQYLDWYFREATLNEINKEHHEWRAAAGLADILIEMRRTGYEGASGTKDKWIAFLRLEVWQKWQSGHSLSTEKYTRSSIATLGNDFVGRWGLIAMALDQYDTNQGNNEYATYINSPAKPFGIFFPTFVQMERDNQRWIPAWTSNDDRHGPSDNDIAHAGDLMYTVMRGKQLGYDPSGLMDETLAVYERLLDDKLFKTSAGFTEWTDGTGCVNCTNWTSAHGHALSSAFSSQLRDRWIEYFRYNDPSFNHSPIRLLWMAGGLLGGRL